MEEGQGDAPVLRALPLQGNQAGPQAQLHDAPLLQRGWREESDRCRGMPAEKVLRDESVIYKLKN